MENYKPNSHKSKEQQEPVPEKKLEKVVQGKVTTKKKSEVSKLADIFVPGDVANVKSYVVMDVLVPAVKKAISDIVTNGIDMILYGESGRTRKSGPASRVSYSQYYDRDRVRRDREPVAPRANYSYNDILLDNRGEAEEVLARMDELVATYGMVSVADLNELVGITGNYTDNNYGWTNIKSAYVQRVRDGYLLKLPRAIPID
jgi:hypothetical protein